MLQQIDPYTEFYGTGHEDDLKIMRTGKYAGIGSVISYNTKHDRCMISDPYENMPAAKAGLRSGDIIMAIDGKDTGVCGDKDRSAYSSDISNALRGAPETILNITVERGGTPLTFHVTRKTIAIPSVSYHGMLQDSIGYICLENYQINTGKEVSNALTELKNKGAKRLILDLRGNSGGVMVEAVNIVGLFLPRGLDVVHTKGKIQESNTTMKTSSVPFDTEIPIVVLTDFGTASAAEITAGVLQDYDRAVIVGHRTYGKGLVQITHELPYNTNMKLTTSKYYIPSGRCIQAYEYKDGAPVHLPDSLSKVFYTHGGRPVHDGGGITPDIIAKTDSLPNLLTELYYSELLAEYTVNYRNTHDSICPPEKFRLSDKEYADFCSFMKENKFTYDKKSREALKYLRNIAEFEGYKDETKAEFDALEKKLSHDIDYDFKKWESDIRRTIETLIISKFYFARGALKYNLQYDKQVKKAIEVLCDDKQYRQILDGKSGK